MSNIWKGRAVAKLQMRTELAALIEEYISAQYGSSAGILGEEPTLEGFAKWLMWPPQPPKEGE